jgi:hypothetical protein
METPKRKFPVYFDKCPQRPAPLYDTKRKRWRLVTSTFTRRSDKRAKRVHYGHFDTEEETQEEVQRWWGVLRRVAGSPPVKPVTLNASEESRLKKLAVIARRGRVAISRKEFKTLYINFTEDSLSRFIRSMDRRHKDLNKTHEMWLDRMSGRVQRVEDMLVQAREILRRFTKAQMEGTAVDFIMGVTDEHGNVASVVDYSTKQIKRVHQQVFIMAMFYEQLILTYEHEHNIITHALEDRSDLVVEQLKERRTTLFEHTCMPALADIVSS